MSQSVPPGVVVHYPCSDDQPMAESEFQLVPMLYALNVLRTHFRHREDVYVGGDMFVYYEEGNPGAVVAPDVFVVIGAPKRAEHPRDTYKLWEEPKGPDFVLEILSSSTWEGGSRPEARALRVAGGGGVLALRPDEGASPLTAASRDAPDRGKLSGSAGHASGGERPDASKRRAGARPAPRPRCALRFRDAATGEDLLSHEEAVMARHKADAAREAAEARVAELEALLGDMRD